MNRSWGRVDVAHRSSRFVGRSAVAMMRREGVHEPSVQALPREGRPL